MNNKKWRKGLLIFIILSLIISWYVIVMQLYSSNENTIDKYLKSEMTNLEFNVKAILNSNEIFSKYVFETLIEKEDVLKIMEKVSVSTNEEEKGKLREQLYDELYFDYLRLQEYDYRQLHFHLSSNESFLRFHLPEKYGDDLTEVREAVNIVNEQHQYVSGFEEGRVFSGFRYVYPLQYKNKFIGSVEVSMAPSAIINSLSKLIPTRNVYFIIDKKITDRKLSELITDQYQLSEFSDQYYSDIDVNEKTLLNNHLFNSEDEIAFLSKVAEVCEEKITNKSNFNFVQSYEGTDYLVNFLTVNNVVDESVGYYVIILPDEQFKQFTINAKITLYSYLL